ncbi:Alpha-(1,3)-fucosyltransferase C, partial [Armadillidium nasatum]
YEIYENKSSSVIHAKTKKIAFGTSYLGVSGLWKKIFLRQTLKKCKTKCDVLFYKEDIPNADAVIFNANDLKKDKSIYNSYWVKKRKHNQVYVLFSMEAPPVVNYDRLEYYDYFFNWTMTYRRDSDVYFPFGLAIKRQTKNKIKYVTDKGLFQKKTAVWFVSHCQTNSKREKFVQELKKYVNVDIYGNCGGKTCGKSSHIATINNLFDDPCISVMKNYIFYLAFENSLCKLNQIDEVERKAESFHSKSLTSKNIIREVELRIFKTRVHL